MKNDGITLVELIIVISIIGVLVVALGFSFQGWVGGYRVEVQVKEMYVDLMNARARAMQRNRAHFVVVNAGNYQIFEDTNESGGAAPDAVDLPIAGFTNPKTLRYPVTSWTNMYTINTRGLVNPPFGTICYVGTDTPDYDCIVLHSARINMGKLRTSIPDGGVCNDTNCVVK